eukprot:CAMPEP_0172513476 /NCGR_PEP_ID=MMETSP1066-20121228/252779_1 /TAXON_ID=671091 /ORGANISM="Coscinodiscus wailesii, Strain CCMP2513" /LENGTH=81 /DNA_ID=CAMNT_0013293759 /DNA_START=141 /DNA_END=386 /DNA_ORIENTATION=+
MLTKRGIADAGCGAKECGACFIGYAGGEGYFFRGEGERGEGEVAEFFEVLAIFKILGIVAASNDEIRYLGWEQRGGGGVVL